MSNPPLTPEFLANIAAALQAVNVLPEASSVSAIAAASVKLPPFWSDDVSVWFTRVEAMFRTANITQDATKFDYIVSVLDPTVAKEVFHIARSPPASDKYNTIKAALIKAFDKSREQKDKELLSISGLGDLSPSAMLRRLQNLRSEECKGECGFFKAKFMALLPPDVRAILATQNFDSLEALAVCADGIMEVRDSPSVALVEQDTPSVSAVGAAGQRNRRSREGTSGAKADATPPTTRNKHVCNLHVKYGSKARSCQPWCMLYQQFTKSASENL